MGQVITRALAALGVAMLIFILVILGTFFGGIAGWIVSLFFADTIMNTLDRFGVQIVGMTMWQLGATLGFISGFFKVTKVSASK